MIKKAFLLVLTLLLTNVYAQNNPLIVVDAKKIGFMKDINEQIQAINPDDVSIVTVFKDSLVCEKYGSKTGVIVITTKKYIRDTFYSNFIAISSLKEKIKTSDDLTTIGIFGGNATNKNQPYDELVKYIDTYTINQTIEKIAQMVFIEPKDAIKLNPEWTNGALEITAKFE